MKTNNILSALGGHLLLAVCLALMATLTACSEEAGDMMDFESANAVAIESAVYDGEWSVNKQVVDTARLVVADKLTLRLPEAYLIELCFKSNLDIDGEFVKWGDAEDVAENVVNAAQPTVLGYSPQGYTTNIAFYSTALNAVTVEGETYLVQGSFFCRYSDVYFRIDLLSHESGNSVHNVDTDLWTIALPVDGFLRVNLTHESKKIKRVDEPFTLYYNAKRRIG